MTFLCTNAEFLPPASSTNLPDESKRNPRQACGQLNTKSRDSPCPKRWSLRRKQRKFLIDHLPVNMLIPIPPHAQTQSPVNALARSSAIQARREYRTGSSSHGSGRRWRTRNHVLAPTILHLSADGVVLARNHGLVDAVQGSKRGIFCAPNGDVAHVGEVCRGHSRHEKWDSIQHDFERDWLWDGKVPCWQWYEKAK